MLIKLAGRRGQTTAEYAILFGLVVGALLAMQVYVRRGLQGRVKDVVDQRGAGADYSGEDFAWKSVQYEPYYLNSTGSTSQNSSEREVRGAGGDVVSDSRSDMNATRNTTMSGWTEYDRMIAAGDY